MPMDPHCFTGEIKELILMFRLRVENSLRHSAPHKSWTQPSLGLLWSKYNHWVQEWNKKQIWKLSSNDQSNQQQLEMRGLQVWLSQSWILSLDTVLGEWGRGQLSRLAGKPTGRRQAVCPPAPSGFLCSWRPSRVRAFCFALFPREELLLKLSRMSTLKQIHGNCF